MGLGPQLILDLADLKRAGKIPQGRRVVEIGAQQLSNAFLCATDDLNDLHLLFGKSPAVFEHRPAAINSFTGAEPLPDEAPSSRTFWESLGYTYAAVEYDGHRDSIALDLNRDVVPHSLQSSFNLVVNSGTTEHIANQENTFRVIHDLTAPGGLMIHDVPAGGMLTHGLFGYNLQFFFVLCRENNYEVLDLGLVYCGASPVHADIVNSNKQFARLGSHANTRFSLPIDAALNVPIFMIRAVLRKPGNENFVTPLDLPEELLTRIKSRGGEVKGGFKWPWK